MAFLINNNVIQQNQYRFLEKSNTTSAASFLINEIVTGLNQKMKTACVFIDVKKAFDCLNYDKMLEKLKQIGIRGKAFKVLENYFENRKQVVIVNSIKSCERNVDSGAAQ